RPSSRPADPRARGSRDERTDARARDPPSIVDGTRWPASGARAPHPRTRRATVDPSGRVSRSRAARAAPGQPLTFILALTASAFEESFTDVATITHDLMVPTGTAESATITMRSTLLEPDARLLNVYVPATTWLVMSVVLVRPG